MTLAWLSLATVLFSTTAHACFTNSTQILCRDYISYNPLTQLKNEATVRSVDTITVNNAKLDLTEDLIEFDVTLPRVSLMDLKNNDVMRIGRRGFAKTKNVEYLYLSHNKIHQIQPDPFADMSKLKILEMNDALSRKMSSNERGDLIKSMFDTKNLMNGLGEIQLNNNSIKEIPEDAFCKIKGLIKLELSDNELENLDFTEKCYKNLKALFVAGNRLTKIPEEIWDAMPELTSLDISNNPIHCDCSLLPSLTIVRDERTNFLNQDKTLCASPSDLKGKSVFDLPKDFCKRSNTSFFKIFLLLAVAGAAMYAYKKYRGRVGAGYKSITRDVEPQFV